MGAKRALRGTFLFAAGAGTAWLYLDKRRRNIARDKAASLARDAAATIDRTKDYAAGVAKGAAHEAAGAVRRKDREYDDVTLARKVESDIFRPPDAPKDSVSVNVQRGVVELRGEVQRSEDGEQLAAAAERVGGVKEVRNLLHTPGTPPQHSPPSEPDEVRARAEASET